MSKEFNLSDKIKQLFEVEYLDSMADVEGDVTLIINEFIKRLKEETVPYPTHKIIDKLAGDNLKEDLE